MVRTIRTLTRADLTAALTAADAEDLIDQVSARPLSVWDGAAPRQTALQLDSSQVKDLAVFLVAVATWLGPQDGAHFADTTTRDGDTTYWPGYVYDPQMAEVP